MQNKRVFYRKGVAPSGVNKNEDSSSNEEEESQDIQSDIDDGKEVDITIDRRMQRLQSAPKNNTINQCKNQSTIIQPKSEESLEDEHDRRARIRAKALEARNGGKIEKKSNGNEIEKLHHECTAINMSNDESTSESESSSDDEEYPKRVLFKPVFVSKNARDTITAKDQLALKEEQEREEKIKKETERKQEATDLVLETLRREATEAEAQIGYDIDDIDGLDEEEEIAAWKVRELLRIKRDREQREYRLVDEQDIERRRQMSDSQIERENVEDGKLGVEKKKLKFMQKYYHKGAFYAGDEAIEEALRRTDTTAPTLEDHQDKLVLPDIMKVKNFGKSGRTKYTHLVDQDTTGLDAAWAKTENMSQSVLKKMGGMKAGFSKPSAKKRRTE